MTIQLQFRFICSECWHFHGLLLKTWLTCRKSTMFVQSLCSLSLLYSHILPSARGTPVMSASPIVWQHLQRTDPSVDTACCIVPGTRIRVTSTSVRVVGQLQHCCWAPATQVAIGHVALLTPWSTLLATVLASSCWNNQLSHSRFNVSRQKYWLKITIGLK